MTSKMEFYKFFQKNSQNPIPLGKLFFLGGMSLALCMSFILALFTPFPMALGIINFGRLRGNMMILACALVLFLLGPVLFQGYHGFFLYLASWPLALGLAEIILKGIPPIKGMLVLGSGVLVFIGILGSLLTFNMEGTLQGHVAEYVKKINTELKKNEAQHLSEKGTEAREVFDFLSRPEEVGQEVVEALPSSLFISVFFSLWANLFLLLKAGRLQISPFRRGTFYTEVELVDFKMPEKCIWPVIALLAIFIFSDKEQGGQLFLLSKTLLLCFGPFYFFQGFGIYLRFLDFLRIKGLFRSFFIILTVITGYWILTVIGLFDMWIDFRKYFTNNKHDRGRKT